MEPVSSQSEHGETNSTDNGFEKVPGPDDHAIHEHESETSVTSSVRDDPDIYGPDEGKSGSEPLISFGSPSPKQEKPAAKVEEKPSQKPDSTSAETSGCAMCGWLKCLNPADMTLMDLIYWCDVKKTGVVFGSLLVLLLSLAMFSFLSVVAYLCLVTLTITMSFRLYKNVMNAIQKSSEGHPFQKWLDTDITIPEDKLHKYADLVAKHAIRVASELRRLFLIDDMVDSVKFGIVLWLLTYIGSWFNGMTLLILGVVGVFTLPKFYETYKDQIDKYLDLAKDRVKQIYLQVREKIPFPAKKKNE